jgi:hypothetical protein
MAIPAIVRAGTVGIEKTVGIAEGGEVGTDQAVGIQNMMMMITIDGIEGTVDEGCYQRDIG